MHWETVRQSAIKVIDETGMFCKKLFFGDLIHQLVWLGLLMCTLIRHFGFMGTFYNCLDTCCFGCLTCRGFVFLYLHLFIANEHVSHGKAL